MSYINTKISDAYQPLFDLLLKEHGLILLDSELDEIIRASQKVVDKINEINK